MKDTIVMASPKDGSGMLLAKTLVRGKELGVDGISYAQGVSVGSFGLVDSQKVRYTFTGILKDGRRLEVSLTSRLNEVLRGRGNELALMLEPSKSNPVGLGVVVANVYDFRNIDDQPHWIRQYYGPHRWIHYTLQSEARRREFKSKDSKAFMYNNGKREDKEVPLSPKAKSKLKFRVTQLERQALKVVDGKANSITVTFEDDNAFAHIPGISS